MSNKQALILIPAYGRKYNTEADVMHDWISGKDFKISGGPYCSIRDLAAIAMDFSAANIVWSGKDVFHIF